MPRNDPLGRYFTVPRTVLLPEQVHCIARHGGLYPTSIRLVKWVVLKFKTTHFTFKI